MTSSDATLIVDSPFGPIKDRKHMLFDIKISNGEFVSVSLDKHPLDINEIDTLHTLFYAFAYLDVTNAIIKGFHLPKWNCYTALKQFLNSLYATKIDPITLVVVERCRCNLGHCNAIQFIEEEDTVSTIGDLFRSAGYEKTWKNLEVDWDFVENDNGSIKGEERGENLVTFNMFVAYDGVFTSLLSLEEFSFKVNESDEKASFDVGSKRTFTCANVVTLDPFLKDKSKKYMVIDYNR